ncbi:hypothetical protein [Flavobacterium alkalisoli]|uniref:hypothetical protein n=1 Tax=Flavobacterium alkalisoli TaxID=2602769 RepID=UPI003A94130E
MSAGATALPEKVEPPSLKPDNQVDRYAVLNVAREIYYHKSFQGDTYNDFFKHCIHQAEIIVDLQREYMNEL